jgi:hypothetical protein
MVLKSFKKLQGMESKCEMATLASRVLSPSFQPTLIHNGGLVVLFHHSHK